MFNFDALAAWWNLQMKDSKKPYWVLHRGAGGKAGQTIATYGTEDVDASWTALVETISNAGSQGVYEFIIVVRPGGVNDTNGKREFQLRSSALNGQNMQTQQSGIYGMNSYTPTPMVDIAGITAVVEEKAKLERELEMTKFKHEIQLERMEEAIEGLRQAKQTNFDRLLETLNNPEVAQGIIGLIGTVKQLITPVQMAAPGIGHVPTAAPGRKRKPQVVEQSAHVASVPYLPDTENEPDDNDDDETEGSDSDFVPIPGLEHDYDCALSAVNVLHSAGWQNPGELLLKVAQFAIKNPAMAKQMLTNL